MNTANTSSLTLPKVKHRFRKCQRCKEKKTASAYEHECELEQDYKLCTPCYNFRVKAREAHRRYRETQKEWLEKRILEGKEQERLHCDSDVGLGRFYMLNGAYIKSGVQDFVLLIESKRAIRYNFVRDAVMAADLLDFNLHTMGTDEYVMLRDYVPSVYLEVIEGAEIGILEAIFTVKKSQNHFFKGKML